MDKDIVVCVSLLIGLTWLLYKLTILLERRAANPQGSTSAKTGIPSAAPANSNSSQELIHRRLRK